MSKKAQAQPEAQGDAAANTGLPLFFKQPAPVTPDRHATATIQPDAGFGFASATNSIPLNAIEFIEAGKFYPIVFTNDEQPMPVALVGLESTNYFLSKDGQWDAASYIPAYVRQYPFVFLEASETQQFILCVDEGSPHYSAEGGKGAALFDEEKKPTALTQQALQFCTAFYNHFAITKNLCNDLKEHKLLVQNGSQVKLLNGRTINLGGFQLIDEAAFNALDEKVFNDFRQKGWLPFIYLALAATSNWKVLADKAAAEAVN